MARRFARGRSIALSTLVMLACAAVTVGMFVTLQSFTLSAGQLAERELGRYHAGTDLSPVATIAPGSQAGRRLTDRIVAAARHAGARHADVQLSSMDVRPTMVDTHTVIQFMEMNWSARPYPDRFTLRSGRWPRRPDEVVLTEAGQKRFPAARPLSVLGGAAHFRVVGVVADRYASYPEILAAPGTWSRLPDVRGRGFVEPAAQASLLWSGGDEHRVLSAVATSASRQQSDASGSKQQAEAVVRLAAEVHDRAYFAAHPDRSWLDFIPAGYTIPSLLLPLLAVLTIMTVHQRRFRRSMATMVAVGMPARVAATGITLATAMWTLVAAVAGAALGLGAGCLARPIVHQFMAQPLSPLPIPIVPSLRFLAATVVSLVLAGLALRFSLPGRPNRQAGATRGRGRVRAVRRGAALLAVAAVVLELRRLDSATAAMTLAAALAVAVLLVVPEIVGAALRRLPGDAPRFRLARRQLLADRGRAAAGVAVLTAALGLPLGFITLLDTMIATGDAGVVADVAPHQVAVGGPGTFQPPMPRTTRFVDRRHLLPGTSFSVRYLWNKQGAVRVAGTDIGVVYVADTPRQAARLIDRQLDRRQVATLRRGGILTWDDQTGDSRVLITHTAGGHVSRTPALPAMAAACDPAWRQSSKGIILADTAAALHLPVKTGATVYTGVPDDRAKAAQAAVTAAGLNPRQVERYESPEPIYVPTALFTAAVGLSLLVLVTALAVARSQVASLRDYLRRLIAVGLSTRWTRHVLLAEAGLTAGLAVVLSLVIALPPVLLAAWLVPHFVLSIPWGWLALVVGGFLTAILAATLVSARRLSATPPTAPHPA